jgi:hypothetical protein
VSVFFPLPPAATVIVEPLKSCPGVIVIVLKREPVPVCCFSAFAWHRRDFVSFVFLKEPVELFFAAVLGRKITAVL